MQSHIYVQAATLPLVTISAVTSKEMLNENVYICCQITVVLWTFRRLSTSDAVHTGK
jgi:hypothetical protein